MSAIEDRLKDLGYDLPAQVVPVANYVPTASAMMSNLIFTSGHVPRKPDGSFITGTLGKDITVEEAYEAATITALGILTSLKSAIGDLDQIKRIVKVLCFVNSTPGFTDQPLVANGLSDLLVEVFGEKGNHARSAVGVAALPGNVCVEIEMIVEA